jgi:hypothetical protein
VLHVGNGYVHGGDPFHSVAIRFRMATRLPPALQPQLFASTSVQSASEAQVRQHGSFAGFEVSGHQGSCSTWQVMIDASRGGGGGSGASLIEIRTICSLLGTTTVTMR